MSLAQRMHVLQDVFQMTAITGASGGVMVSKLG